LPRLIYAGDCSTVLALVGSSVFPAEIHFQRAASRRIHPFRVVRRRQRGKLAPRRHPQSNPAAPGRSSMAPFQALRVFGMAGPIGEFQTERAPLLRFLALSALAGWVALSGFAIFRTMPLRLWNWVRQSAWSKCLALAVFRFAARSVQSRM